MQGVQKCLKCRKIVLVDFNYSMWTTCVLLTVISPLMRMHQTVTVVVLCVCVCVRVCVCLSVAIFSGNIIHIYVQLRIVISFSCYFLDFSKRHFR